jgi:hypothetical protein
MAGCRWMLAFASMTEPVAKISRLTATQSVDFRILGKTPELFFRKGELAVDGDFEHPAHTFNELNLGTVLFFQSCLRTEGSRKIVSRNAVFDPDLHRRKPFALNDASF